ncbi:Alpha/Beta hydrolase protein [Cladorrhinum sp. PSN259]|nr:Alpha/Beta hydrolase protein [Cladorrhinum sp. PSN259]
MSVTSSKAVTLPKPQVKVITFLEKLLFFLLLPVIAIRTLITYLTYPKPTTLHHRQRIAVAFLQAQRKTLPWKLLCWTTTRTTTSQAITQYCSSHKIAQKIVKLDPSSSCSIPPAILHILTPPPSHQTQRKDGHGATCTLVYFHGGGYVNPLRSKAHMPFILNLANAAATPAAGRVGQVIVVEYSLAPAFPYPTQLVQCIESIRYLMSELKIDPSEIIMAGDSAGGQLVGGILAHVVRPCPYALPLNLDDGGKRFGGAVMISPFVRVPAARLPLEAPLEVVNKPSSYEKNARRDYLTREQVDQFKGELGADERELYANLCMKGAAEEVWGKVFGPERKVVDKVLVTVGTGEVFLDCCRFFNETCLKGGVVQVKKGMKVDGSLFDGGKEYVLVECEGEVHVQPALDAAVGYKEGLMNGAIMAWMGRYFG